MIQRLEHLGIDLQDPPVGFEEFLYELPEEYGGSLKEEDLQERKNGLMAFDIRTGMSEAQKAFEKKEEEREKDKALTAKSKEAQSNDGKPQVKQVDAPIKGPPQNESDSKG